MRKYTKDHEWVRQQGDIATVGITVNPLPNVAPVAVNDTVTTMDGTPVVVPVLANDSDSDGTLELATLTVIGQQGHGN